MMISDLPCDLESEILARVPTKSLAELKITCKRWYALFRDPNFVKKKNLRKAARELMILSNSGVYSIRDNLHGIHNIVDPSIDFTGKLSSRKDSKDLKISRIFHCDGLILCSTKGNTRLVVWNPSTGQTRSIKPRTCYQINDTFVLGYVNSESSGHSYKILRSHSYQNDQKVWITEFDIYEFSSDSWKVLDITCEWGLFCDGMSLKGSTYWVAGAKETGFFMLCFDFTTETFGNFPLPFQSDNPEDTAALSVVKEEKLSVLHQDILAFSNVMTIWLSNKIDEAKDLSWSEFILVVDFDTFNLPSVVNVRSFLLDEENKVAVCCDVDMEDGYNTRIYIVGKDMYKQVYKDTTRGSPFNWPHLLSYVPSLVYIQENTLERQKKRKAKKARTGGEICKKI
ncbi:putative F-box/kelch-repeat protein [Cardamine amara subsp. amara]|uniref:F-box/kelch-repeat protein n=1 Tax=Cardamine amara subsp. amara TaxID=228776 RepID=A0ABD1A768_CARAN